MWDNGITNEREVNGNSRIIGARTKPIYRLRVVFSRAFRIAADSLLVAKSYHVLFRIGIPRLFSKACTNVSRIT